MVYNSGMVLLHEDEIVEYKPRLSSLKDDESHWQEVKDVASEALGDIRRQLLEIAYNVGGDASVILPAGDLGGWNRIVSHKGSGLDVGKLETVLGTKLYRELCCDEVVQWVPSPKRIEEARSQGLITDDDIREAYNEGDIMYTLRKMSPKQIEKHYEGRE